MPLNEYVDFYSHASCEARLGTAVQYREEAEFLLTRLLRGATESEAAATAAPAAFLLTRPMRGATGTGSSQAKGIEISTHTPHAGRDR